MELSRSSGTAKERGTYYFVCCLFVPFPLVCLVYWSALSGTLIYFDVANVPESLWNIKMQCSLNSKDTPYLLNEWPRIFGYGVGDGSAVSHLHPVIEMVEKWREEKTLMRDGGASFDTTRILLWVDFSFNEASLNNVINCFVEAGTALYW